MHETAQNIVSLFRRTGSEYSTSEILENISPEYAELRQKLKNRDDSAVKKKIAKLHRKAIHHLNKLVKLDILSIVKHGEHGEKFFSLRMGDDEELSGMTLKYKRIHITRPVAPAMPIEGYEQKGIIRKFDPTSWIDRLNSVVVFTNKLKNSAKLYNLLLENIFPIVNDAISLEHFESAINRGDAKEFLEKINPECEDYGKKLTITIDFMELKNIEEFLKILALLGSGRLNCINMIFALQPIDIDEHLDLFSKIIEVFSNNRMNLYIKNKRIQRSPYFIGRAGPFCFIDKEWQFSEELRKNVTCLGCSQSTVLVDVNKFYNEYGLDISKFSELMFKISKSVLSANSLQRRKANEYFSSVNHLNKGHEADFLLLARDYIRFWNFGSVRPGINPEFILNMINEARKRIDDFAAAEERIYKSCGMTTRFKIALSCAFGSAAELSPASYARLEISDFNDLYNKEIKKELTAREILSDLFDGGNEVTFHYTGAFDTDTIIRQIRIILSSYRLPLFNYNFQKTRGDLKLSSFMENGNN